MSVAPAPRARALSRGPRSAAALHRQGDQYRLVVAVQESSGPRITAAVSLPASDIAAISAEVARHKVERVYRLIPGAATVCRVVDLPGGNDDQLLAALALQSEAQSPPGVPVFRRAAGIVEGVAGARHGLIVAWPGESTEPAIRPADETWVSEGVALAQVLGGRAQTFAAYADPDSNSITVAATGLQRMAVRTVRESASGEAWSRAVSQVLRETLSRISGQSAPDVSVGSGATLILEHTARRRLDQIVATASESTRGDWINHFGLAAIVATGALVAAPGVRPLMELTPALREARRSPLERGAVWIAHPRRAVAVIVVGVLLSLLLPLGLSAARASILQGKLKKVEADEAAMRALEAVDKRVQVYDELNRRRWGMTKLLSYFAQLSPAGIDVEFLQLVAGQRFVMRGSADSLQLVAKVQEALNSSGVFDGVTIDKSDSSSGRVKFDISGDVSRPNAESARGAADFATISLARQLYGDRAIEPTVETAENGSGTGNGTRGSRSSSSGATFDRTGSASKAPEPVPEALTDDAVNKMNRETAGSEMAKRRKAASRPDVSATDKERLRAEVEKLRGRLRDLQGSGGGG